MPPKTQKTKEDNLWQTTIENAKINDEFYKVKVVMFDAAESDHDRIYLDKFESIAKTGNRFVIKNISKSETMFMINQLGRSGTSTNLKTNENLKVFEKAQNYITDKKEIPSENIALIIKHLILQLKDDAFLIKRRKMEVKEGMGRESKVMLNKLEVKEHEHSQNQEVVNTPKVKDKNDLIEPRYELKGKKFNTLLRTRSEEWRDMIYVEDYPIDGPNLYVAVTNFCDPHLAHCLIKIKVPVTAVVQIKINVPLSQIPPDFSHVVTKRVHSQSEMLTMKYIHFWQDLERSRTAKDTADDLRNTAFIVFSPPYKKTEHLSSDPEKIYNELSYLLYDIQDLTRQHLHYLDNISTHAITSNTVDKRFFEYYENIFQHIPLECVTIYSVLENILQTISEIDKIQCRPGPSTSIPKVEINKTTKGMTGNKSEKAQNLVTEVFNTLCKNDENKMSYRLTYGEEFENQKDPIVIDYGNIAKYSTFHLENLDLNNIIKSTLSGLPIHKLWLNQDPPEGELEAKINYHVNVLLSCFERKDVETSELTRLIHILTCRKLYNNRSSLLKPSQFDKQKTIAEIKNSYLRRSVLTESIAKCSLSVNMKTFSPTNFPLLNKITETEKKTEPSYIPIEGPTLERITYLFDCPDISELVSAAEIAVEHPINHIIDDFEYFEDFEGTNALQILHESFNKYNCMDYKYCKVTDCLIIMFFNSHDKYGIAREDWRSHIPTAVCLQDFFDFILDDEYDWIHEQEEDFYDVQNKSIHSQTVVHQLPPKSCIENCDIETEMLLEGSLKYQKMVQAEQVSETVKESVSVTHSKNTPRSEKASAKEKRSPKITRYKITESKHSSLASIEMTNKVFSAYDLGDRRVEVFGKETAYYSRDGTKVKSMYFGMIPMQYEWIILNVVPGDTVNDIWIHKELSASTQTEPKAEESFRITTKDHVMINIKKRNYQIPSALSMDKESPDIMPNNGKTESFHSLYVTWANGLVVESVHEENSPKICHIKQTYLTPMSHLNEDTRCISPNGEVIVFKSTGEIEVFQPDGTCIKITKYRKRVIYSEKVSRGSSASSKIKKGNDTNSMRSNSKSSMYSAVNKDMLSEYKLTIEEYEVITTNGLKQKCINNQFIDVEKLLIRTATDYYLGEIFSRRLDGTCILLNSDSTQIVTFPDGTKIITKILIQDEEIYPEWTEDEIAYFEISRENYFGDTSTLKSNPISLKSHGENSQYSASIFSYLGTDDRKIRTDGYISVQIVYITEHANFATVTIDKSNDEITVDSPNGTSVAIGPNNYYKIELDKATKSIFNGKILHIEYEACAKCRSYTTCDIRICANEESSIYEFQTEWLKLTDSFCKKMCVDEDGVITFSVGPCFKTGLHNEESIYEEESPLLVNNENGHFKQTDLKSDVSFHGKCRDMNLSNAMKFFVLRRDMSCSELIHRTNVDDYKRICRWKPWCSINSYNSFGDHRRLVSILSPVHLNETEKWLMNTKMAQKPKNLKYKDLKIDKGKGFYQWMRPYEFQKRSKIPVGILPPRQPRAFILRTLEKQWTDKERHLNGAKELIAAVLKYRGVVSSDCSTLLRDPIQDPRPEKEKHIYESVQAIGEKIYEGLKQRLADDVRSEIKTSITTKPPMSPEQLARIKHQEERHHNSLLRKLGSIMVPNPHLERYWKRRAEAQKEEEFYKYLLRLPDDPPPYFRNIIGGIFWSKINALAGDAVDKAERKNSGCFCDEDTHA